MYFPDNPGASLANPGLMKQTYLESGRIAKRRSGLLRLCGYGFIDLGSPPAAFHGVSVDAQANRQIALPC